MGVALVAALELAEVGLVRGVHVHVLFAVGAVGEAAVAAFELALERFFAFEITGENIEILLFFFWYLFCLYLSLMKKLVYNIK